MSVPTGDGGGVDRCLPVVVNRHHLKGRWPEGCVYVGRTSKVWNEIRRKQPHVDDGTALGNPFTRWHYPKDALDRYARWLWKQMNAVGSPVLEALGLIYPDSLIVCGCAPKPCHADVVVGAWCFLRYGEVPADLRRKRRAA